MTGRPLIQYQRENGQLIALLPVLDHDGSFVLARLSHADQERLGHMYVPLETAYLISGNVYVTLFGKRKASVARLILDLGPGQRVRYRDGNPMNMLRTNMETIRGKATHRDVWTVHIAQGAETKRREQRAAGT